MSVNRVGVVLENGENQAEFHLEPEDQEVTLEFTPDVSQGSEAVCHTQRLGLEKIEQLHGFLTIAMLQLRRRAGLTDQGRAKPERTQWDPGPATLPSGHEFRNGSCIKCGRSIGDFTTSKTEDRLCRPKA